MFSRVTYYFTAFALAFAQYLIFPMHGQCTVQNCETNGDSLINIAAEVKQMIVEAIRQQQYEQVQRIDELLNTTLQRMKNEHETAIASLQTVDQRFQEQVQGVFVFLNASFQQMKIQQDAVFISLQAVDQRSKEQDIYVKQVQTNHRLLNDSLKQMNDLNALFRQLKDQQVTATRQLDVVTQLLLYHDTSIKNETQNSWKLQIGVPLPPEIVIDLGDGPVLLPSVNKWVVVMNRFDGSVNFNRNWSDYKHGFGDIGRGEFWLGNEKVHRLTNRNEAACTLRIEVYANGTWFHADYSSFSLDSESDKYVLRLSGYSGSAGDSLIDPSLPWFGYHGGMRFSTYDVDNDNCSSVCGSSYRAGWWFNCCDSSCLTCPFGGYHFNWRPLRNLTQNGRLRAARMMIRSSE